MAGEPLTYRACGFFLLRAPALPASAVLDGHARARTAGDGWQRAYEDYLECLWLKEPEVEHAVRVSSAGLAAALDRLPRLSPRDRWRALSSLGRYVNRMGMRPTPFGLMAGVAGGLVDPAAATAELVRETGGMRLRARPDMAWVLGLAEAAPAGDERYVANELAFTARGRVWLPTSDAAGQMNMKSASVRQTEPVTLALAAAVSPVPLAAVRAMLADRFPGAGPERIAGLVASLVELEFLVSARRPRLQVPAGPGTGRTWPRLDERTEEQLGTALGEFNAGGDATGLELLAKRLEEIGEPVSGQHQERVQVDAALVMAATPRIPAAVAELAEKAVQALSLVGSVYQYPPPLAQYAAAFTEHYGSGALVRVLDLLTPETGLGPPEGYLYPERAYPLPESGDQRRLYTKREGVLWQLVCGALAGGDTEIDLEAGGAGELARISSGADDRPGVPAIDVHLQVWHDRRWQAAVSGSELVMGGRTFGRFHDLLDAETRHGLAGLASAEEALDPGLDFVELSYLPNAARAMNVAIKPALRQREAAVNAASSVPDKDRVRLADVLVTVEDGRLVLVHAVTGRQLYFTQQSLLNPLVSPNACRFLLDVSVARYRPVTGFRWGTLAERAPRLPRLRYGDVVLKRAHWTLRAGDLSGPGRPTADDAIGAWRDRWRVPDLVSLTKSDNSIMLDLSGPVGRSELRAALAKDPAGVELQELLPLPGQEILVGSDGERYRSELVIPVRCARDQVPVRRRPPAGVPDPALRLRPPGSDWVFLKLYCERDGLTALVTEAFPELRSLARAEGLADPFFMRYGDPAAHLRVRLRDPRAGTPVTAAALRWAAGLLADGLVTDIAHVTYHRELERYGGPELIGAAEEFFRADSTAVLAELIAHRDSSDGVGRLPLAALTVDAVSAALGLPPAQRRGLAAASAGPVAGGSAYRVAAAALWDAAHGTGAAAAVLAEVTPVLTAGAASLGARFAERRDEDGLAGQHADIVASLVHMHCNRLGLSREEERETYGIWRRLLDRQSRGTARRGS